MLPALQALVRAPGAIDASALQAAWATLVAANPVLGVRIRVAGATEDALQVVDPDAAAYAFAAEALAGSSEDIDRELAALGARERARVEAGEARTSLVLARAAQGDSYLLVTAAAEGCDAASLRKLVHRLLVERGAAPAGAEPIDYFQYAEWQHDVLQDADARAFADTWRAQLQRGADPLVFLPLREEAAGEPAYTVAACSVLAAAPLAELRYLAARLGVTPARIVEAAVLGLFGRLAGMQTFSLGLVLDGRTLPELGDTIGPLAQTLPLAAAVAADDTLASLVRRLDDEVHEAADRQDFVDWNFLHETARANGAVGAPFVFPFCIEWIGADAGDAAAAYEVLDLGGGESPYRVKLTVLERRDDLVATWTCTDRVDAASVAQLSAQWRHVLAGLVGNPAAPIEALGVADEDERARVREAFAVGPAFAPAAGTVLDLIVAQVRRCPDAVALRSEEASLSYAALDLRARRLAVAMRAHVREGVVGIDAAFVPDAIVLMLAALQAGLAYLPLDLQQPPERLAAFAAAAGAPLLVFGLQERGAAATAYTRYLRLHAAEAGEGAALPAVAAQSLAYVILTSGSTGTPKGVGISHAALAASTLARAVAYDEPVERFVLLSPLHVDSSVAGIYWTLATGGELVMPSEEVRRDARRIGALVAATAASHLLCIPSLYKLFLEEAERRGDTALRVAIVAAEPCRRELVRQHERVLPRTRLYNEYGPSEATVWASVFACDGCNSAKIPIGRPTAHAMIHVLEAHGRAAAIGEAGEIHIGGAIASGYWRNPAETALRFVPDASSGAVGGVLYRSGDYGWWNADATLMFSGRRDGQVKVLGFRVELSEIWEAIEAHAAVRESWVRFLPESQEIVAYVSWREGSTADAQAALRDDLGARLPRYMQPHRIVALERLPRLPGGKVHGRRLDELERAAAAALPAARVDTPDDSLEALVASVWQGCLPNRVAGRHANFFATGGNSLNGIQVVSRLQDALQNDRIGIRDLFEHPVLSDFVRVLRARLTQTDAAGEEPLLAASAQAVDAPAAFFQERLYFLHLLDPGAATYNCPFAIRLHGVVDADAIETALRRTQETHAGLRTTLQMREGELRQIVGPADFRLERVDLGEGTPPSAEALLLEEGGKPFDLQRGPLLRATLFTLAPASALLVVVVHHAVFDGWSLRVLVADFKRAFAGLAAPVSVPLAFTDYAAWQQRQWRSGVWRRQLDYWREHLRGAPNLLALPTDRPRRETRKLHGHTLHFRWPAALAERIQAECRQRNITAFMFFEALLALVLHRYSGQDEVLIGTPVANRVQRASEALIGPVANTVAIRNAPGHARSWNELLAQVRSTVVDAYCNQDVPFEKVVDELKPIRTLASSPLFQVMLVVQNVPMEPFELEGLRAELVPHRSRSAKFDLTLSLFEEAGVIAGQLEYDSDLFDQTTVERLLATLARAAEAVLDEPAARLDGLEFLSEADSERLHAANPPAPPVAPDTLLSLFDAQVRARPDAIAASCGGAALSYAALDRRANCLAARLRARGVGCDEPVALVADRSLDLMIALLGILKAGAAYLPLDVDAPSARLERLWERAGRPYTITDGARPSCAFLGERELRLDTHAAVAPCAAPRAPVVADQLAYVIHTSGSTGEPKGAMLSHAGIVNRLQWMQEAFGLRAGEAVLQKTPYTFDVSVWELFWPLLQGARVAFAAPGEHRDPAALRRLLAQERIAFAHFVPSMLGVFLQTQSFAGLDALRGVVCSGEALDPALCARFFEQAGTTPLHNLYGPTEASVDVSCWHCVQGETSVPIGRAIRGIQLHVATLAGARVPPGGVGELLIGGVGVGRGYLRDPVATAQAFAPDPWSPAAGARLYRSGDLARRRGDGAIEFLGRRDHQVKLRGIRVELGEIEHALKTFDGVADAAVVALGAGSADVQLVAYVSGIENTACKALRQHLAALLPAYLIPAHFVPLAELPKLGSGKVDRNALAREVPEPAPARAPFVPRSETESILGTLWVQRLRIPAVNAEVDFFAAGGHSLAAVALLADINAAFGIDMSLQTLLESPSFADLALRIDGLRYLRGAVSAPAREPADAEVEGSL